MGTRKKAAPRAAWRLAGEPAVVLPLEQQEEGIFSDAFFIYHMPAYRSFSRGTEMALTAEAIQAREGAARAAAGFFCAHFSGTYSRTAILTALAQAAALPLTQSEFCAGMPSFLLGAALWLLDYFEQNRRGVDFLALLPLEFSDKADYLTPDADDLTHGRDMVLRLMTVLLDREGEHRRTFRKLLSLIDKETAAHLRHRFRDALLDYFRRLLEHCDRAKPAISSTSPPCSPLLSPTPPPLDLTDPDAKIPGLPDDFSFSADFPGVDFLWKTPRLMGRSPQAMREELHTRRAAELLSGFTVGEPYALCAAYLLLEREGDALAHLNSLTAAVMYCAEAHLPWAPELPFADVPVFERTTPDDTLRYPYSGPEYDPEEDEPRPSEGRWLCSEAQLFYLATGVLPPRDRAPSGALRRWFVSQGIPEGRARALACGALYASCAGELRLDLDEMVRDMDWSDESKVSPEPVPLQNEPKTPPDSTDSTAQITALSRQLKEARSACHEAEQAAGRLQGKIRELEQQAERDRAELAQLRETLLRLETASEDDAPEAASTLSFPWRVTRRVLSFGGHDTWSKAIRPLLPGMRFYEREMLPDLTAIRGADVIWLQTNALSHKHYYRIMEAARREGIPVRYFAFASARKCAEQVVQYELETEQDG